MHERLESLVSVVTSLIDHLEAAQLDMVGPADVRIAKWDELTRNSPRPPPGSARPPRRRKRTGKKG